MGVVITIDVQGTYNTLTRNFCSYFVHILIISAGADGIGHIPPQVETTTRQTTVKQVSYYVVGVSFHKVQFTKAARNTQYCCSVIGEVTLETVGNHGSTGSG
jgi:hypothetical protein